MPIDTQTIDQFAKYLVHNPDWGIFNKTLNANDFSASVDAGEKRDPLVWELHLIEIYNRLTPVDRRYLKQRAEERGLIIPD